MADLKLSNADLLALAQMGFGEGASADNDEVKMMTQTALNRLRSGRTKEFGRTIPEIIQKGYYAASKQNEPYKQAISGNFPDLPSKTRFSEIQKLVQSVVGDKDYGNAMFYFTPDEETKLRRNPKNFNFKAVKPQGRVGRYNTYSY